MIVGTVTGDREAVIPLEIAGPNGRHTTVDAVIDTGFDGWLSLPAEIVDDLELPWRRRGRALVADGTETVFDIHEARVVWDDELVRVPIDVVELKPLIGMALLEGFSLHLDVREGGAVRISPLQ